MRKWSINFAFQLTPNNKLFLTIQIVRASTVYIMSHTKISA